MVPKAVAAPWGETSVILLPAARPKRLARVTPMAIASGPMKASSEPPRILLETECRRFRSAGRMPRTKPPALLPRSSVSSTWPSTTGIADTTPGTAWMRFTSAA